MLTFLRETPSDFGPHLKDQEKAPCLEMTGVGIHSCLERLTVGGLTAMKHYPALDDTLLL